MKSKLLYTLIVLAFAGSVNAQDYFYGNAGFEAWRDSSGYSEPRGWYTLNSLSLFGLQQSTTMVADAHGGQYAALLVTQENSFQNFPGLLSSALILNSQGEPDLSLGKIPFTMRPKNFSLYYKAMPAAGDSCSGIMILTRWNVAEQRSDTIGVAGFYAGDSVTTYTQVVATFEYDSPLAPDSAFLLITSSANGFDPVPGSTLYVDDFVLGFETGLSDVQHTLNNVSVYPNPSAGRLTIRTEEPAFSVSLFDLQGRSVYAATSQQPVTELETTAFANGIYMLEIRSEKGVARQKVVIGK